MKKVPFPRFRGLSKKVMCIGFAGIHPLFCRDFGGVAALAYENSGFKNDMRAINMSKNDIRKLTLFSESVRILNQSNSSLCTYPILAHGRSTKPPDWYVPVYE
jgi:hypothetical protein